MLSLANGCAVVMVRLLVCVMFSVGLAYLGVGSAHAATYQCTNPAARCTEPQAYAEARAYADATASAMGMVACVRKSGNSYVGAAGEPGCNPNGYTRGTQSFYFSATCAEQPEYTGQGPWSSTGGSARSGSIGCRNGCDGIWGKNADSSFTWSPTGSVCPDDERKNCESPAMANAGYYWNVALSVCEPPKPVCEGGKNPNSLGQCAPEPCPDGMAQQADSTCKKKDNECPAGQIRSPDGKCLPGDGQCSQGEARGPDGTCKKDSDGDGNPDPVGPDDPDTFSGGDSCSAPPACSGSPIMCGQARIQWRIDCNTRKNRNIAGGSCAAMPVCTGEKCDAMEYAGLLMQWRSACALEKMAGGPSNGGDGADVKAIRDALTGTGGSVTTPADRPASDVWSPGSGQPTRPDASGYGWGRGCPQPPAIDVMGKTITFDITPLCRWLGLGSYFVVGLAALFCLRIIASKDA
ncbi:TPA: hypothetical protein QDZ75_002543 [Stenotrophomonas maltophilia]|nr:hypothetical protein [Stenotrophomonas maltophilia]